MCAPAPARPPPGSRPPSLRKMFRMCVSTVLIQRNSSAAISGLVRRSTTRRAISSSRPVSAAMPCHPLFRVPSAVDRSAKLPELVLGLVAPARSSASSQPSRACSSAAAALLLVGPAQRAPGQQPRPRCVGGRVDRIGLAAIERMLGRLGGVASASATAAEARSATEPDSGRPYRLATSRARSATRRASAVRPSAGSARLGL